MLQFTTAEDTGPVLISHDLCPYVQRAAIALQEKQVPFERIDIDLAAKPDWFLAISPLGKVPVLRVGAASLFESSAILEYLEETQGTPLHPHDPLQRARHRAWIEVGSTVLGGIAGLYGAVEHAAFDAKAAQLRRLFEQAERTLEHIPLKSNRFERQEYAQGIESEAISYRSGDSTRSESALAAGPYFAGERFSLVDAVFGPVFRYFDVFDTIADFGIVAGLPRVGAWREALAARPSVRAAVRPDYPQRLRRFLSERNSHMATLLPAA